jgi:uncharacterized protein involved in type VI secretion and phage assembly
MSAISRNDAVMARLVRATHEHRARQVRGGASAPLLRTAAFMDHPDKPGDDEL